jgi:hypothetical protein
LSVEALRAQLGSLDGDGERVLCERVNQSLQAGKPEI